MNKKIIMLVTESAASTFLFNALQKEGNIVHVIMEEKISKKKFLKRRIKRLGYMTVFGQILFQLFMPHLLQYLSKKRIQALKKKYHLDETPIPVHKIIKVSSVNARQCIECLQQLQPDLIIVNGTRIISKKVLKSIPATFVNTHAGITPKYRGVHGGYWAMANQDQAHCGVTVHLIDRGIDTGGVLYQQTIQPISSDNFVTYPYLQMGEGIQLMRKVIVDCCMEQLKVQKPPSIESKLWYHPTIWSYLYQWRTKGVK